MIFLSFENLRLKRTYQRQTLTFFIADLNRVRRFGLNGMRSLSKSGAKMHPFELSSCSRVHIMANWLCQFLCMPHLNNLTMPICHDMHPGVRTEVQKGEFLHRVMTMTSCHRAQNGGPGSKLQLKNSTSIFCTSVFNLDFQNLKKNLSLIFG